MKSHLLASYRLQSARFFSQSSSRGREPLSSTAPKPNIGTKHIREKPELWSKNCVERNHHELKDHPLKIVQLFDQWRKSQINARTRRQRSNETRSQLSQAKISAERREIFLEEARKLKDELAETEAHEAELLAQIDTLAAELPNLTSEETPRDEPKVVGYINEDLKPPPDGAHEGSKVLRDHVHIGTALNLVDFSSAAKTTGWGWYFLKDEAADLEDALTRYALSVARKHGLRRITPPSMVYTQIGTACGFRPRDQNGEQQVYSIQSRERDQRKDGPSLSLSGTAEIPFAGMMAGEVLDAGELPEMVVGVSRCYRAEAGARGAATKGLYRVHEFTKVEMFAWTAPGDEKSIFNTMLQIQTEILTGLGLCCRILEMPASDLGHSAFRKRDIETYVPSRHKLNEGWGEVTSTSICTDYQTRRLDTRMKSSNVGETKLGFPYTVNGTALAVPRILLALLEYGVEEGEEGIRIRLPEVLWPHMLGGEKVIERKGLLKK